MHFHKILKALSYARLDSLTKNGIADRHVILQNSRLFLRFKGFSQEGPDMFMQRGLLTIILMRILSFVQKASSRVPRHFHAIPKVFS